MQKIITPSWIWAGKSPKPSVYSVVQNKTGLLYLVYLNKNTPKQNKIFNKINVKIPTKHNRRTTPKPKKNPDNPKP